LENAPEAAADRHSPAIVVISLPVGGDKRAGGQVPTLGEVIIEERLQRHGIHVFPVLIASKGPEVKDQEASCYVQRPIRQEDDKIRTDRVLSGSKLIIRRRWKLKRWPKTPHQACITEFDRLPWREEKFWGEVAKPELGVANLRAKGLF